MTQRFVLSSGTHRPALTQRLLHLRTRRQVPVTRPSSEDLPSRKEEIEVEERTKVQRSVRAWYIIEKIAEREKIFATEDDVHARIEEIAIQQDKTPTQVLEEFQKEDVIGRVRSDILEIKVRKFLTDAAQIVEEEGVASKDDVKEEESA